MSLPIAPKEIDGHGLLTGKVVLVTAAAGTGIGSSTARRASPRAPTSWSPTTMSAGWARPATSWPGWASAVSTPWSAT